jgi:hypothetical protein
VPTEAKSPLTQVLCCRGALLSLFPKRALVPALSHPPIPPVHEAGTNYPGAAGDAMKRDPSPSPWFAARRRAGALCDKGLDPSRPDFETAARLFWGALRSIQ